MQIIELKAQNIKNLKAVEIRPDGEAVILEGKNGAGKSAILDAIFATLTGKKIEDPIRHGEKKAEVVVDLGDLIVKKVWTPTGVRLEVTNSEGLKYSAPQQKLNDRIGKLSFDPLAFKDLKDADQAAYLKDLVGLNFDDSLSHEKAAFDERTIVNRKVKELEVKLKDLPIPPTSAPTEEISMADAMATLKDLRAKQEDYAEALDVKDNTIRAIEGMKAEIINHEKQIEALKEHIANEEAGLKEHIIPEEITDEQIQKAEKGLENLEATNKKIRQNKEYGVVKSEFEAAVKEADQLTTMIAEYKADREKQIQEAKFPIEGLSITENGVAYGDVLFSRLSTGQQVRVSTAIAMALNPDLRVILIREGSLLDKDGLAEIIDLAKNSDYNIWIERVADEQSSGIFIEDGSIKEAAKK